MTDGGIVRKSEIVLAWMTCFGVPHTPDERIRLLPDCAAWSPGTTVAGNEKAQEGSHDTLDRSIEEHMAKRMIVMLAVTALFVAALGFVKFKQVQTAIAQGAAFRPPPEAVTTIVARQEEWPNTLGAIGTAAAVQGVTVSADLPGIVERITFDSGTSVREGEVLALLDTRQEQAQLAAAEARSELTRLNFDRMQGLLTERVISRAEFDRATAEHRQADAARRRDPRRDRT